MKVIVGNREVNLAVPLALIAACGLILGTLGVYASPRTSPTSEGAELPKEPQTSSFLSLELGPDGHDYLLTKSGYASGFPAVVHAAGCRKCAAR